MRRGKKERFRNETNHIYVQKVYECQERAYVRTVRTPIKKTWTDPLKERAHVRKMGSLDEYQRRALVLMKSCQDTSSVGCVRAGAGSGKTRVIAQYANTSDGGLLCVSHTRAARDTIYDRLDGRRKGAVRVQTIHQIAYQVADDMRKRRKRVSLPATPREAAAQRPADSPRAPPSAAEDACRDQDFDKLLCVALEQLTEDDGARKTLRDRMEDVSLIVVDEFQDTSPTQMRMIRSLKDILGCGLVVVGDLAQSIYSFQDASPDIFRNMISDNPGRVVTLPNNYRSHPHIVRAANTLASMIPGSTNMTPARRCAQRASEVSEQAPPLRMLTFPNASSMVQYVVMRLREHVEADESVLVCSRAQNDASWPALLQVYNAMLEHASSPDAILVRCGEADDRSRLERSVSCLTVHSSKGGEWDHVIFLDRGEPSRTGSSSEEEEELRILFVAWTRARTTLSHVSCQRLVQTSRRPRETGRRVTTFSKFLKRHHVEGLWSLDHVDQCAEACGGVAASVFYEDDAEPPRWTDERSSGSVDVVKLASGLPPPLEIDTEWFVLHERPIDPDIQGRRNELRTLHGKVLEDIFLRDYSRAAHGAPFGDAFFVHLRRKFAANSHMVEAFHTVWRRAREDGTADVVRNDLLRSVADEDGEATQRLCQTLVDVGNLRDPELARRGIAFMRMQTSVDRHRVAHDVCPVRFTIPHYDQFSGPDAYKLQGGERTLYEAAIDRVHLEASPSTEDLVLSRIFRGILEDQDAAPGRCGDEEEEARTCAPRRPRHCEAGFSHLRYMYWNPAVRADYVGHIESIRPCIERDASAFRTLFPICQTQVPHAIRISARYKHVNVNITVRGRCDAITRDGGVVEVKSSESQKAFAIAQAMLYLAMRELGGCPRTPHAIVHIVESRRCVKLVPTSEWNAWSFIDHAVRVHARKRGLPRVGRLPTHVAMDPRELVLRGLGAA